MHSWNSMEEFEAFLDDGGLVEPDDDMPDAYRQAVFCFIELHANSEYMGGLTERDWIAKAPGLSNKLTALAKTQDEIGHAHLLYMVAADMGVKTRDEMTADLLAGRTTFHNVFHYRALHLGGPNCDRIPGGRGGARQPAGRLQEVQLRPLQAHPAANHRRGGLPHAQRRGAVAEDGQRHAPSSTS